MEVAMSDSYVVVEARVCGEQRPWLAWLSEANTRDLLEKNLVHVDGGRSSISMGGAE